ncbi:MAG: zinc ABC transporter substrate-binding protein [Planctomycetes bacterium]|nr:zinc ABC transporter substrate-binding protein [Planctomycetota bacterium]
MKPLRSPAFAALLLSLCVACSRESEDAPADESSPYIATSLYPLRYLAQRLIGDEVRVVCPLPPDADPLHWQPDRAALQVFAQAKLVALNGAGVESWRATASLPLSRTIDTTQKLAQEFEHLEAVTHSHGGGEHTHEGVDGHTWLDPLLLLAQAEALREGLVRAFPGQQAAIQRNFAALEADLRALDQRWRDLSPRLKRVNLLASHPAYNYPSKRYAFPITNLDLDPERELGGGELAALAASRGQREFPAVLLWESEPLAATRAKLESDLLLSSVVFSPCENPPRAELDAGVDYLSVMRRNLDLLEAALPR